MSQFRRLAFHSKRYLHKGPLSMWTRPRNQMLALWTTFFLLMLKTGSFFHPVVSAVSIKSYHFDGAFGICGHFTTLDIFSHKINTRKNIKSFFHPITYWLCFGRGWQASLLHLLWFIWKISGWKLHNIYPAINVN